jgi:toxin YhaV
VVLRDSPGSSYRLFYRFASKEKVIIYAWLNDEKTHRKPESETDLYSVFRGMLEGGDRPGSIADLLQRSKDLKSRAE